ncbi:MAG: GTP 3',8-cyclase MoaA [Bacteroidetes bacterium]|nr:GTP 3',8-cyclase MoaA [Bacteroidota bacterium]
MKSLTDPFGRIHNYLRISVTDRCNLRCMYCMPPGDSRRHDSASVDGEHPAGSAFPAFGAAYDDLPHVQGLLTFEEIIRVARIFTSLGVNKIRLTGGEPLVRKDLPVLVSQLAQLSGLRSLGMTTNGVLLEKYAQELRDAGLTHLNISLDTLRPDRFVRIAMKPSFASVMKGIESALKVGFQRIKLNVVVMGNVNDDELPDFVAMARTHPVSVRFIEYMPFRSNKWETASFVSWHEMLRRIARVYDWSSAERCYDDSGVAREYRLKGWSGTIGFITSMTEHFCDDCNRLRLTADGSLKSCLFHPAETNLRSALRTGNGDDCIETLIRAVVAQKPATHAPVEQLVAAENRSMIEIGG